MAYDSPLTNRRHSVTVLYCVTDQRRESEVAVAESLEGSVEVAASRAARLKHSYCNETPQSAHTVDWHHVGRVIQVELVFSVTTDVIEDHRQSWCVCVCVCVCV